MDANNGHPEILGRNEIYNGRFLRYDIIDWKMPNGTEGKWESVERASGLEAVLVIPWLMPSESLLLIKQFRPPAGGYIIEFPAGVIDEGETCEDAAIRELKEETGYIGQITKVYPATYNTPGLSGESVYNAIMSIDEGANPCPATNFDDGEFIENIIIQKADIPKFLDEEIAAKTIFDSKVMSYLLGMDANKGRNTIK